MAVTTPVYDRTDGAPTDEELLAPFQEVPGPVAACGLVFGIVIVGSGIFGNAMVVVSVASDRRLRRRMNVFIASMALADLLLLLTRDVLILDVYRRRSFGSHPEVLGWVYFTHAFRNSFSVQHIVAITVYRYVFIVHNAYYPKLTKTPVIVAILALIYSLPVIAGIGARPELLYSPTYAEEELFMNTKFMQAEKKEKLLQALRGGATGDIGGGTFVLGYVGLHALMLCVCYIHLFFFMRKIRIRMQAWGTRTTDTASNKSKEKELRVIKTMAVVFVFFVLSYIVMPIFSSAGGDLRFSHWVCFPFFLMNWISSCNWMIYVFSNELFRDAFCRLLRMPRNQRVEDADVPEGLPSTARGTNNKEASRATAVSEV